MKLFLKHIGEHLRLYPQVRFTRNDEILIRNSVMSHLGLTNINQLRDRFEGQAFFEKTMKNIGGLLAVQKYLKTDLIDFTRADLTDFQPSIELNDEKFDINVFDFGTLPLIDVKDLKNPTYFIIQKNSITFLLCGYATTDVIKDHLIETSVVKSSTIKFMNFTGFKYLKEIEHKV